MHQWPIDPESIIINNNLHENNHKIYLYVETDIFFGHLSFRETQYYPDSYLLIQLPYSDKNAGSNIAHM